MSQYTLALTGMPSVPTTFQTASGSATPSGNVITFTGTNGISFSASGSTVTASFSGDFTWTDEATNFNAVAGNGYFCTASLTATLPASPTQGQVVVIECDTTSNVTIRANTGQFLRLGATESSSGGSALSTTQGNSAYLVYRSASSTWNSISTEGTWSLS